MRASRAVVNVLPYSFSYMPIKIKHYINDHCNISALLKRVDGYEMQSGSGRYKKDFFNNLREYCYFFNLAGASNYLDSYFEHEPLECVKKSYQKPIEKDEVILVCCVKNDLMRIKKLHEHHAKIGINYFVFVDNMSDDGTLEWLKSQNVDVYITNEKYHAGAKAAWIKKIQDIYGYDRWYLIVDSDELFSYIDMESHNIKELVAYATENGIIRVRSMLLDMYPMHDVYADSLGMDFLSDSRFFDYKTYYSAKDCRGDMLRGGPRARVLDYPKGYDNPLTKYPLLYASESDVWGDHTPIPFKKNYKCPLLSVLRHYKFLGRDMERFEKNAEEGNYYNGSIEYKTYVKKGKDFSFYYENSVEYYNSDSLRTIPYIKSAF